MKLNPFYKSTVFAGRSLHLGVSGSVACYKSCELLRALLASGLRVSATLSAGAREFIAPLLLRALGADPVYEDMFSGDQVFAHLEPGEMADIFAIVPASANILAELAHGNCSRLLAAQFVAFTGPVLLAPAMNPRMWAHPATQANVRLLQERGALFAGPARGRVACGDSGQGRLADLQEIFLACLRLLSPADMDGQRVLVTLGPTREYWDGARFWSNPSSGAMGTALVTAAWLRGAEVYAICGPGVDYYLPEGIARIETGTAREMQAQCLKLWPAMTIGICCAAVADFAPVRPPDADNVKIAKSSTKDRLELEFEHNPDILLSLANAKREGQRLLGFAAQIAPSLESLACAASEKLAAKKMDLIAANRINASGGAFGAEASSVLVMDRGGRKEIWQVLPKADIAWKLLTWLLTL